MEKAVVISRQVADRFWTALQVENSTSGDILAVGSCFEGVGAEDVPQKARAWAGLAADLSSRYHCSARVYSHAVLQPVGLYEKIPAGAEVFVHVVPCWMGRLA